MTEQCPYSEYGPKCEQQADHEYCGRCLKGMIVDRLAEIGDALDKLPKSPYYE